MCLRVGIIGVGNIGSMHLNNFINGNIKNAKVTALCDIDSKNLYRLKDKLPEDMKYFDNASELIKSGCVDGVLIATPHYDHPIIAIEALEAGLHVFCEKPAGVFTKNVRQMNEVAKKSGKVFAINFVLRLNNYYKKIKEMIDAGELGRVKRVTWIITNWYRTQTYFDRGGWRASWAGEGGGTLLNQNPHQLDLLQWITGMPKRVRATCYFGKYRDVEVEDEATAYFEYEDGSVATYITSVSEFPGTNRLEIAGDRGKIVYEDDKITFTRTTISEPEFNKTTDTSFGPIPVWKCDVEASPVDLNECQAAMVSNWAGAALGKEELIAPGCEGIKSLSLSNAIYLSAWNDNWVEFPFDEDEFLDKLNEKIKNSTYVKKTIEGGVEDLNASFHR